MWCDGDTLHRLTVEVQTTITLESVRCVELSPLELERECVESRLDDALSKIRELAGQLACWDGE